MFFWHEPLATAYRQRTLLLQR